MLEYGIQSVVLDKVFGPLIMCGLRISINIWNAEWVVERERYSWNADQTEQLITWEEVARIDGQESLECEERHDVALIAEVQPES